MIKKKNKNEQQATENQSFFDKYKTDKKYKAKVQLIGYGIFILILIAYLNISNMNATSHGNITTLKNEINNKETSATTEDKQIDLLEKINNNYEYTINTTIITNEEEKEVKYSGRSAKNNMEITKEINTTTINYYKVDSRYYKKDNDTYELAREEDIYDVVGKEYIELNDVKEYIDKSSLDHVTEYSTGKKEYVYHLKVKEIIKSYQGQDEVEIKIIEENNILTIIIDYTNLMKLFSEELKECMIEYTYQNIDSVEEFTIIEEDNNKE